LGGARDPHILYMYAPVAALRPPQLEAARYDLCHYV